MSSGPYVGPVAGFVIGALLGYLFFHDPGDSLPGTLLAAGALGIAGAAVAHGLVRRRSTRRTR